MNIINKFEHYKELLINENIKTTKTEKLRNLLIMLGYDIMYHEEHKEYFIEASIDDNIKTIWLYDFI